MTPGELWIPAVVGLLAAMTTGVLAPILNIYVPSDSRLLRYKVHVALAFLLGFGAPLLADHPAETVAFAVAAVGCALLIVIDLAVHRLPNPLVAASALGLLFPLGIAAQLANDWSSFGRAVLAGLVLTAVYFVLAFINPAGMGLGDVKFAMVIGIFLGWFGWSDVMTGTVLAFLLNGLIALGVVLRKGRAKGLEVPFGPAMVLGALLALTL